MQYFISLMSEIRVLFLGIGIPVPIFIRNRIEQLDKTGQIEAVVLAPRDVRLDFQLINGLVLPQLPVSFNLSKTILPLFWLCVRCPVSTIRLWKSLSKYPPRVRIRTFVKYHSLVRIRKINVVHFQWIASPDEINWAKMYFEAPVIISARGSQLTVYPATEPGYEGSIQKSLAIVDYVHAVSQSMAEACIRFGANPAKIFINYNGIDLGRFNKACSGQRSEDTLHLISTGTLLWRKGYLWQLILTMTLKESGLKIMLNIIGDGPDRQGLQYSIIKLGLQDTVILEGKMPSDEVIKRLQSSDIYISTSAAEGLSNAVLEAVACGLPVVAFDCEGMDEIIDEGHNGFIVPFGDIESMAEKVRLLYSNRQLLENIGLNGAFFASEKFNYWTHVQTMIEFYKSVCMADE